MARPPPCKAQKRKRPRKPAILRPRAIKTAICLGRGKANGHWRRVMYAQVIKHQRRRRTVEVERRMLVRAMVAYRDRLGQSGLSVRINTAFVERINLTIRQCVSKLTRRTLGPAKYTGELTEYLEWWRAYYHFVRPHESLIEEMARSVKRKGKQQPRKYRKRTPAMLAGLTDRPWTVKELLTYPLP